MLQPIFGFFI